MKIYVLKGNAERGKTTCLKQLACMIYESNPTAEIVYSEEEGLTFAKIKKQIAQERKQRRLENTDIETQKIAVVIKIGKRKIGIYSDGDYEKDIGEAVKMFEENACDIAFGICRSKGLTIKLYEDLYHEVEFIDKAEIKSAREFDKFNDYIDKLNDWQAGILLSKI